MVVSELVVEGNHGSVTLNQLSVTSNAPLRIECDAKSGMLFVRVSGPCAPPSALNVYAYRYVWSQHVPRMVARISTVRCYGSVDVTINADQEVVKPKFLLADHLHVTLHDRVTLDVRKHIQLVYLATHDDSKIKNLQAHHIERLPSRSTANEARPF